MASILVTGASRGIGRATCVLLGRAGHRVFATMRDPSQAPDLSAIAKAESLPIVVSAMDVDSDDSVRRGVGDIVAKHGPIGRGSTTSHGMRLYSGILDLMLGRPSHGRWARETAPGLKRDRQVGVFRLG